MTSTKGPTSSFQVGPRLIAESLSNNFNVKTFSTERFEVSKFGGIMFARVGVIRQSMNKLSRLNFHQKFAISLGFMLNFMMAVHGVSMGTLSPGDLVLLNILMSQVFVPLTNLGNTYRIWQESFYQLNELLRLLSKEQHIKDKPDAVDFTIKRGHIQFRDVDYCYSTDIQSREEADELSVNVDVDADQPVSDQQKPKLSPVQRLISIFDMFIVFDREASTKPIEIPDTSPKKQVSEAKSEEPNPETKEPFKIEKFNLEIQSNEVVLVSGASGVGKTTLINMLIRLIEPQKGRIIIDGTDISDMTLRSLRDGISFCPQNHYFFNDSFINNIKFAHIDRYFSMDQPTDPKMQGDEYITFSQVSDGVDPHLGIEPEIYDLVRDFDLLKTIEANEEGWNFSVGDNGDKLSGGQKQRLNLIRSLLKDAGIYIFDEPSNFLDTLNRKVK